MEDIEIEYLDEYKDYVLPGIKTSVEGRAATTASLDQAASRIPQRRRTSSGSSSSSIDPDIFQKLFDDQFLDDELLNDTGSNAKGRYRRSLSSSSSDSNDALDALYNRQSSRKIKSNKRDRLESYDSLDDLGAALMGSTQKLSLPKTHSSLASKKAHPLHRVTSVGKPKPNINKPSSSSVLNNASKVESGPSIRQVVDNKRKAVTIIKAPKPDLKPPKNEPKIDPLQSDSDSSFEYESDSYDYDLTDDEGSPEAGAKQVIDISTDTSAATSLAETVTPVVSEDEGNQQQQQQTPNGSNDRLQSYLNNLSCAETPPSRHKHQSYFKKSRSNEKTSPTPPNQSTKQDLNDEDKRQLDESSRTTSKRRLFDSSDKLICADYVDANVTYETVERLSITLAEQINNIDAERSVEFAKRSGSKPRSISSSKVMGLRHGSLSSSHVRKLTYSHEALDAPTSSNNRLRRAKSDGAFSKGNCKKRISLTEEKTNCSPLTPLERETSTAEDQSNCNPTLPPPKKSPDTAESKTTTDSIITAINPESTENPVIEKRKRGRPRKKKDTDNIQIIENKVSKEDESEHISQEDGMSIAKSECKSQENELSHVDKSERKSQENVMRKEYKSDDKSQKDKMSTEDNSEHKSQEDEISKDKSDEKSFQIEADTHCEEKEECESQVEKQEKMIVSTKEDFKSLKYPDTSVISSGEETAVLTSEMSVEQDNVNISRKKPIENVDPTALVTDIETEHEILAEKIDLNDKLQAKHSEQELEVDTTSYTVERDIERLKEEEKDIKVTSMKDSAKQLVHQERKEGQLLNVANTFIENEDDLLGKEQCSSSVIRRSLRSVVASQDSENITEKTSACNDKMNQAGEENSVEIKDFSIKSPTHCSKKTKTHEQEESNIAEGKTSSKKKNTLKKTPRSGIKKKSCIKKHIVINFKSSKNHQGSESTKSILDLHNDDTSTSHKPMSQDISSLSEKQPISDNCHDMNNEDFTTDKLNPQNISLPTKVPPVNDNITPNVENNLLTEVKSLRADENPNEDDVREKHSSYEDEPKTENLITRVEAPASVVSIESYDNKDIIPNEWKSQSEDLPQNVNMAVVTEIQELATIDTKLDTKIEIENIESLNQKLMIEKNTEMEITELEQISKKLKDFVKENNEAIDEQSDASNGSQNKSIKLRKRNTRVKVVSEMEGPTTRSRSCTPSTRLTSREKEHTENSEGEVNSPGRISKALSFAASTMIDPKLNNLQKETDTAVSFDTISVQQSATPSNRNSTLLDICSDVPSTPSTSSLTHSVRKLRILVKKPATQGFKKALNIEQQEPVEVNDNPVDPSKDTPTIEAEKSDVDFIATETDQQKVEDLNQNSTGTHNKPNELAMEIADKDHSYKEKPEVEGTSNSCSAGTTGVTTTNDDDMNFNLKTDDSQPDEIKRKQLMQMKVAKSPLAGPKRPLSTGKSGLGRPTTKKQLDVDMPDQKRQKLEGQSRELKTKTEDEKKAPVDGHIMESITNTDDKKKTSLITSSVVLKVGKVDAAKKSLPVETAKIKNVIPKSTIKSTLSSLLGGNKTPTNDNSVIITKSTTSAISSDQLKKSELSPTKVTANGINISVTMVPDANNQEALSPKKTLTQAATVKKMLARTSDTAPKAAQGVGESLPPAVASKPPKAKASEAKRISLPAKTAVPKEESNKKTTLQPRVPGTAKKSAGRKTHNTLATVANPVAATTVTEATTRKEPNEKTASDSLPIAKPNKKVESRKATKKTISKIKPKDATVAATAEATLDHTVSAASSSTEISREPAKRTGRGAKAMLHATDHVTSTSRSATATPTATASATPALESTPTPTSLSTLKQNPLPQRQPRKSLAQKKTAAVNQTANRSEAVPQPPVKVPAQSTAANSRKRKLPASAASETPTNKRAKEQLATASVAFPVRITAASAVMMPADPTLKSLPKAALQQVDKQKKLKLLPIKFRKLRVLMNRSVIKRWLALQQKQKQQEESSQATGTTAAALITTTQPALALQQKQSKQYPVPMPALEVKEEGEVADVEQLLPEHLIRPEVSEAPPPSLLQVVAPIPRTVNNVADPLVASDNSVEPSLANPNDVHKFGTTRMFSFLYPSRYQKAYSNVGLDYCCPNLDGPMQAIDPTRLHSQATVPVLELPQFMVITTKIISKHDKNIPPKVRAKLEQMSVKNGLPCVKPTSSSASSDPPTSVPPAVVAPSIVSHIERLPKPLPRGPILTKNVNPSAVATSAAVAPTVSVSTPTISDIYPGLLQLPPVCPTDKMRVELQTRVQLFDAVLQGLARRAASMSVAERERVIENIVRTSTLMPIDVDVGTKLLENYTCYLNVNTDTLPVSVPRVRSIITTRASPPLAAVTLPASTKNISTKSQTLGSTQAANSGRKVQAAGGGAGGGAAKGTTGDGAAGSPYSRPIYDKDRNVIGYQYKGPKIAIATTAPRVASTRSSTGSLPAKQQPTRIMMGPDNVDPTSAPNAPGNTLAVVNEVSAPGDAQRVGSDTVIPLQTSGTKRTYVRKKVATAVGKSLARVSALGSSTNPVPTYDGSNRNVFIVNPVLSPEESILPDTVGTSVEAVLETEIKGEVEDADIII